MQACTHEVPPRGNHEEPATSDSAGGPGRTRTCNRTVMSGPACSTVSENIDVFRDVT